MVWYGRTMHERARSTQSSMSAMRQYLHEGTSQTATEPRKGILHQPMYWTYVERILHSVNYMGKQHQQHNNDEWHDMTQNMIPTPTTNCSNICQNVTHQVDTMPLFRPVSYDIWALNPEAPGAWPGLLHYCSLAQGHTQSASMQWSSHSAPTTAPTHWQ